MLYLCDLYIIIYTWMEVRKLNIGDRIRYKRKQKKMSADKLGELIGKDRATVYRYENNEIDNMPYTIVSKLSEILEVQPSYLMGWDNESDNHVPYTKYNYFQTPISAGIPNNVDGITECETINVPDNLMGKHAGNNTIFFTHINGESMNKVLPDKSVIAVKPITIEELKDGDIVVYSDAYDYGVKRFYRIGERLLFKPESKNPTFTDNIYSIDNDELKIHGKVISYTVVID